MIQHRNDSGEVSTSKPNVWRAGAVLLAGLTITAFAVIDTKSTEDATAKREFGFVCNEIQRRIVERFNAHEQVLRSGAAIFYDSDGVTREEWHCFAERQKVDQFLPGIQSLGFALLIPREKLAQHVREIQAEGFPAYRVHPAGDRAVYSSIIFIEPFTNRNLCAFGHDMLSEPMLRTAMEQARDQDKAVLSGKVCLPQETESDVQAGTLMFVPVYRMGMPRGTVAQRRAALQGWVYSPYRMTDLMRGVLGGWDFENGRCVRLEIFDSAQANPDTLLYDSHPGEERMAGRASRLSLIKTTASSGRTWTLRFSRAGRQDFAIDYGKVWLALFAGTSVSVLLFGLLINLLNTRAAWRRSSRLAADLRESEGKYRRLVENSPDVIYTLSADGLLTFVSPSWTAILGHPVSQVIGRRFQLFVHPDAHAAYMGWMQRMIETGQRQDGIEYRVKHCDGTWRWHNSSAVPVFDGEGTVIGFEGIATDITGQKQLETTLRESESRFDQLAEQSGTFIWEVDPQGRYTFVSHVVEAVLGYRPDELVGRLCFYDFHPESGREEFKQAAFAVFERKASFRALANAAQTKDGRTVWLSTSGIPLLNMDGSLRGYRGSDTDITEHKRLEESLGRSELMRRHAEKMEAIGQLAGGIAHDFNNILCGIIGYADMSLEHAGPDSVLEDNLRQILKASARAKQLVKQILTFSRKGSLHKTATSLRPLLEEVLQLLQASIPSSVIMKTELSADTRPVLADPTRLHEAFINLATNAVHAMGQQGTLTIRLYAKDIVQTTHGRIGEIQPGSYSVIEISDTGCGMDAATLSKAFEPFFTTKAVGEGTGMGLSVVLGVVQSHGGDIQVESELGKGSTFSICLPVTGEPEPAAAGDAAAACRGGTETILFVDDEPMLTKMAQGLLSGLGYSAIVLNDCLAALDIIKTKSAEIDLVVTDQTMPGMTGIELAKAVRKIRSDLPVILCTGFSSEVNPKRVAAAGIRRVIMKPFTPQEFGTLIRDVLDGIKELSHGENTGH